MQQKDLAAALGISPAMVCRLAKRGMPTDSLARAERWRKSHLSPGRVKGNRFDPASPAVRTPRVRGASPDGSEVPAAPVVDPEAAGAELHTSAPADTPPDTGYSFDRARREKADADTAEINLLKLKGDLVRRAEVHAAMAAKLGDVRTNLLQIPARLAPLLAPETDQARVQQILDAELRAVLNALTQ